MRLSLGKIINSARSLLEDLPSTHKIAQNQPKLAQGYAIWEKSGAGTVKHEFCICAAVKAEDGTIIKGHRHRDCRDSIVRRGKLPSKMWKDEGFITSKGRFVNREEGFSIMQRLGWKSRNPQGYQLCSWLFSEDLY